MKKRWFRPLIERTDAAPATPATASQAGSQEHGDPDEVDISDHFYQPSVTPRSINASPRPDAASADAQLRQLLLAQQQQGGPNPFPFGDGPGGAGGEPFGFGGMGGMGGPGMGGPGMGGPGMGGPGAEGAEGDPFAAMLNQMMQTMGGAGGPGGGPGGPGGEFPGMPGMPGMGAGGGFPGFPGFPGMGGPGQQQQTAKPSKSAALWRLVHFAVAVALGLYVALATPFTGTRIERDAAAAEHAASPDGVVYSSAVDNFALHKRYFFYAFATAETVLLTSRIFLERGTNGSGIGGTGAAGGGLIGMAMGFLPPTIKRNVEIAMRYWQIFSTVRSDLLVCVFVLGVCAWVRS